MVLPIVTVIGFVNVAIPVASCPAATEGLVSPNPVPKRETISPGLAGDAPATTLGSATRRPVPASSAAMLVEFGNTKNAGAECLQRIERRHRAAQPIRLARIGNDGERHWTSPGEFRHLRIDLG